jgi:hypothetical protein
MAHIVSSCTFNAGRNGHFTTQEVGKARRAGRHVLRMARQSVRASSPDVRHILAHCKLVPRFIFGESHIQIEVVMLHPTMGTADILAPDEEFCVQKKIAAAVDTVYNGIAEAVVDPSGPIADLVRKAVTEPNSPAVAAIVCGTHVTIEPESTGTVSANVGESSEKICGIVDSVTDSKRSLRIRATDSNRIFELKTTSDPGSEMRRTLLQAQIDGVPVEVSYIAAAGGKVKGVVESVRILGVERAPQLFSMAA